MKAILLKLNARLWHRLYQAQYRVSNWSHYRIRLSVVLLLFICATVSFFASPWLIKTLNPYLSDPAQNNLPNLRSLLLNIGSAMVGASAIAFSLVVFAMQVNVERMPHGLFRRFSTDPRILASFAGTFAIAIAIATSSLMPDASWAAIAVIGVVWGIVIFFLLFLNAYRRALQLINPLQQLTLMANETRKDLESWVKRTKRITPLLEGIESDEPSDGNSSRSTHDMARLTYLGLHTHWTFRAQEAIAHCMSFAQRFAEQGDQEVSFAALKAVVYVNQSYVKAKGKTFFATIQMVDNPLVSDGFINNTLELIRQHLRAAVNRGDEQQIEQSLQALAMLVAVYIQIDYCNDHASKTHAQLAASYLSEGVKTLIPHNIPDALMEGVRLMGVSADLFVSSGEPNGIVAIAENVTILGCAGCANDRFRPVTVTAIEQLARLTFNLIRTNSRDVTYAIRQLRKDLATIVKLFLQVPDTPLQSIHSTYLAPYFSSVSNQAFLAWQIDLVNELIEAKHDDEVAKQIILNISIWSKQLYSSQKEILLLSIEKRSGFTFDVMHWITSVTEMLIALSNCEACQKHVRDELRKDAKWLVNVIGWIPGDEETVKFTEIYRPVTLLFETAIAAHFRMCPGVVADIEKIILNWAFKAGKYQTGWGTLEQSLYALVTLALTTGSQQAFDSFKERLENRLTGASEIDQEIRGSTARDICETAETFYPSEFEIEPVKYHMGRLDRAMLRKCLLEIAGVLSPGASNEPVRMPF